MVLRSAFKIESQEPKITYIKYKEFVLGLCVSKVGENSFATANQYIDKLVQVRCVDSLQRINKVSKERTFKINYC